MPEMDPYDPTTWGTQATRGVAAAHEDTAPAVPVNAHRMQAAFMAEMLVTFLETLERHALSHEEALYLAAHVWRAA